MSDEVTPRRAASERRIRLAVAIGAAALFANCALGIVNVRTMVGAYGWVAHTHQVIEESQLVLSSLQDVETGQRGFVITGKPAFLEPYESGAKAIHEHFGRVQELTGDDPGQQRRLDEMRPLIERRLAVSRRVVELRRGGSDGFEAARAAVLSGEGKELMDELRDRIAAFSAVELRLEAGRAAAFRRSSGITILANLLGTLASFALIGWALQLMRKQQRERARAAEMLAVEEERLRATLTSIGDAVIVTDEVGRVTVINRIAETLTGWKAEEATGRPLSQVFHIVNEDTRQEVVSPVDRVLREGVVVGLANHTALIAKDGSERPIADSGAPIRDRQGHIAGVVLVFRDQAEERRAEAELARLATQRQLALDSARMGWWHYDPATRIAQYDEGYKKIFGVAGHERPNDEILKLIHPDDLPRVWAAVEAALDPSASRPYAAEYRLNRPDGTERWVEAHGVAEFEGEGADRRATSFVGTVADITERKRTEEAISRSRQGLSRLAEASGRVIGETDLQGMLQAISEAALTLTEARIATCGHGDIAGRSVVGGSARVPGAPLCQPGEMFLLDRGGVHMDLVDGADAVRLTDAQLRAHPRWWGGPAGHVPLRGLLGVRMVGRNGRTNGLILVTDKAHGEFSEEDESLLRQLATIASLALQHVEARISLEASDRSKNEFLAMLSHELRNPLAPIRNSLYILDRAPPGGEQAKRAHTVIDRQIVHLTRLVDDLLDVTRISRGKVQLRRERLQLGDLLRQAVDDHHPMFAQAGIRVRVVVPEAPLWIDGDRTRILQVIGNLLSNSAKFTERGGEVSVSLTANESLRQAVVRVRDTGVGIGPDMLPRVFEPFAQADNTLDRSKGGLGLGLTLVKGLVEMHGGSVTVDSEGLGRGTEFAMRLPLDAAAPPALVPSCGAVELRGQRILVIEDNHDAADSLREVLELAGHTVAVAYSGSSGIDMARTFHPDAVLCDIGLPGLDGYQVARAMRADSTLRGAKLVALTGYAAPEDVARSVEAGFDAHIAKPPDLEALQAVLGRPRAATT